MGDNLKLEIVLMVIIVLCSGYITYIVDKHLYIPFGPTVHEQVNFIDYKYNFIGGSSFNLHENGDLIHTIWYNDKWNELNDFQKANFDKKYSKEVFNIIVDSGYYDDETVLKLLLGINKFETVYDYAI